MSAWPSTSTSAARMPPSYLFFHTSSGVVTKWRTRQARREGFIP
jgi:hypothetical protein